MRDAIAEQLVWYGISLTRISMPAVAAFLDATVARIFTEPRPVR